jgi:predicted O-methyltransferase YrrM
MNIKQVLTYINYRLTAYTEHDVHSPFVYDFYTELIKNENPYSDFERLDELRKELLNNTTMLEIADFGAGSKKLSANQRSIQQIARHGIAPKKQAEFLYRLVNKFAPKTLVELGTSVGLTSLYLAKANSKASLYTLEGSESLVSFSKELFKKENVKNIISIAGNFDVTFPELLKRIEVLDCLYLDGNHAYEPTLRYFELALAKKHPGSFFIFDDINWSDDMQKAWQAVAAHKDVRLSFDFFHFGIVFFRTEQKEKEQFTLRF